MLRLAILCAVALGAGPAWADTVDVASLVRDGGPWGMVTVLCAVIGALWLRINARDATIADLQDKRAEEAKATIKDVVASSITSTGAIADSNKRLADHDARIASLAERIATVPEAIARIDRNLDALSRSCGPRGVS